MAPSAQQDPPQQNPPATDPPAQAPEETEAEKNYWKKLEGVIDGAIDRRIQAIRAGSTGEGQQGTQRTGRVSLFDMFADWMGGPFAPPKQKK